MIRTAAAAVVAALIVLGAARAPHAAEKATYDQLNLFGDVFEIVRAQYVSETSARELVSGAISGMLAALDPHSGYMDGETYREMQERTSGSFGGLGIEVRMEEGAGVLVVRPMLDTPAYRAGVEAGDIITHLDGAPTADITLQEAVEKMRGPVDSSIDLTIQREGLEEPLIVSVTRAVIRLPSVDYRAEGNAAYIRITSFSEQTASGIRRAMSDLKEQLGDDFAGGILDVRNNPGGLLEQSVAATEAFLDRGEVVLTRGRDPNNVQRFTARRGDLADGKPIIVLINGGSASASEIVAGALQDHQRAIVLGTQSFGKGSVQTIMPMGDRMGNDYGEHGAIRLTTSRYYTPSGRSIQATGITPDIIVEQARVEALAPPAAQPEPGEEAGEQQVAEAAPPEAQDYQLERAKALLYAMVLYQQRTTAVN